MDRNQLRKVARIIPAITWICLVTWLSLRSAGSLKKLWVHSIVHFDKLLHAGVYLVMAGLVSFAIKKDNKPVSYWSVILFCGLWGVLMEVLQYCLASGRDFDVFDIIANIIGSLVGVAGFKFYSKGRHYGS